MTIKWITNSKRFDYAKRKEALWTPSKVTDGSVPAPVASVVNLVPGKLGFWQVAFAIVIGNLMTALIYALLYGLSRI